VSGVEIWEKQAESWVMGAERWVGVSPYIAADCGAGSHRAELWAGWNGHSESTQSSELTAVMSHILSSMQLISQFPNFKLEPKYWILVNTMTSGQLQYDMRHIRGYMDIGATSIWSRLLIYLGCPAASWHQIDAVPTSAQCGAVLARCRNLTCWLLVLITF